MKNYNEMIQAICLNHDFRKIKKIDRIENAKNNLANPENLIKSACCTTPVRSKINRIGQRPIVSDNHCVKPCKGVIIWMSGFQPVGCDVAISTGRCPVLLNKRLAALKCGCTTNDFRKIKKIDRIKNAKNNLANPENLIKILVQDKKEIAGQARNDGEGKRNDVPRRDAACHVPTKKSCKSNKSQFRQL